LQEKIYLDVPLIFLSCDRFSCEIHV